MWFLLVLLLRIVLFRCRGYLVLCRLCWLGGNLGCGAQQAQAHQAQGEGLPLHQGAQPDYHFMERVAVQDQLVEDARLKQ